MEDIINLLRKNDLTMNSEFNSILSSSEEQGGALEDALEMENARAKEELAAALNALQEPENQQQQHWNKWNQIRK